MTAAFVIQLTIHPLPLPVVVSIKEGAPPPGEGGVVLDGFGPYHQVHQPGLLILIQHLHHPASISKYVSRAEQVLD